jgi:hypothetical protein
LRERSADTDPGDRTDVEALQRSVGSLNATRRHEEALQLLRAASGVPESISLTLEADTHEAAHQNGIAVELRKRVCEASPGQVHARFQLVGSLIRAGLVDEAADEISTLEGVAPGRALRARIALANAQFRVGDALELVDQIIEMNPASGDNTQLLAGQLLRSVRSGDLVAQSRAREWLSAESWLEMRETPPGILIRLAMSVGWLERAAELAALVPPEDNRLPFWRYRAFERHQAGDVEGARAIWSEMQDHQMLLTTRTLRPGELVRLDERPLDPFADEIRLFTVVRDELSRLPWFLDYYRTLGVDRFVFVDNDSVDGTREFLLEQTDVHLFHTTVSYADGMAGMVWVNALASEFGRAGWVMYVDVDEALVYGDVEKHGLRGLTSYMDRRGHEAAAGQMVDMFSLEESDHVGEEGFVDFVARYRHFDHAYGRYPVPECPYFFTAGGIRGLTGFSANCTKTPLVRAGVGIAFLGSSHTITPAVISDVDIALLHYKFTDNLVGELEAEERRLRPTACQARYRAYATLFAGDGLAPLVAERATIASYESSRSLQSVGLLAPLPEDFV